MRGKIYDISELNRALPLVRAIVEDVIRGYGRLREELTALGLSGRSGRPDSIEERELPWSTRDLLDELRGYAKELGELGVVVRDLETGLVEAYGEKDGKIVYFSWKPGDGRVRFWHGLFHSPRERKSVHAMA